MKTIRKLALGAVLLASSQMAMAVSVPNIDFENGLTGWNVDPATNITTSSALGPNQGNFYGQINGSGTLTQLISVSIGQVYEFMWRFRTTEVAGDGYNDQALVFHVNGSDTLVTVNSTGNTGGQYDSGWHRFSWVSTVATTGGLFAVSLFNEGDNLVNSQLLLDAVPLPVAPLLFGSALLGFAALRKKLIAKPADLATA